MKIFKVLALITLTLSISSCAATVTLDAAPNANDPTCAEVIVRLPDAIGDLSKRVTNAQSTGAWGNPTSVILRCGLPAVEASKLICVTAKDVDWLVDDSAKPNYRFTTFGRNPATEVIVNSTAIAGVTALESLAGAVENIPATKRCQ